MPIEDKKVVPPVDDSTTKNKVPPVGDDTKQDEEFESELKRLEDEGEAPKPDTKDELEKAKKSGKSIAKRIKELGGDPNEIVSDIAPVAEKPSIDMSKFVTKEDLAKTEAEKLAKSPAELKLIMHWIGKGMSVTDAHFMANKNRITKLVGEVTRTRETVPAPGGGGAGERPTDKTDAPELSADEKRKLEQSGMKYDPAKKAYVGKKVQHRYDEATKAWVTERI